MHRKLVASLLAIMMLGTIPITTLAHDYEGHWASAAIDRWKDRGIIEGFGDGTFRPKEYITRAQFAKIMVELFGYNDLSGSKYYTDVATSRWYSNYVKKISASGIMYEIGNRFRPDDPITREETAYALANAYKLSTNRTGNKQFTDEYNIAAWAIDEVKALHDAGYIEGLPNGSFNPKGQLTRAEFITMIDRMNAEVINQSGTYRNNISGNVVVNTPDVNLKNMTIYGNLYLAEGIGSGDIRLENVTVKGKTYVEGGGINSIKSNDSTFEGDIIVSAKNPVRIVNEGKNADVELLADTEVILTGTFNDITVYPNVEVTLKDAKVENMYITDERGSSANIEIRSGSQVRRIEADKSVDITGSGTVRELVANVNGVKIAERPDKISTARGVTVTVGNNTHSSSSSSTRPNYRYHDYRVSGRVYIEDRGAYKLVNNATIRFYENNTNREYRRTATDSRGYYEIMLPRDSVFRMEIEYKDSNGKVYTYTRYLNRLYEDIKLNDIILKEIDQAFRITGRAYVEIDGRNTVIATGATIRIYAENNTTPINTVTTDVNGDYMLTVLDNHNYRLEGIYRDSSGRDYHYSGMIGPIKQNQTIDAIYLRRVPAIQIHS